MSWCFGLHDWREHGAEVERRARLRGEQFDYTFMTSRVDESDSDFSESVDIQLRYCRRCGKTKLHTSERRVGVTSSPLLEVEVGGSEPSIRTPDTIDKYRDYWV